MTLTSLQRAAFHKLTSAIDADDDLWRAFHLRRVGTSTLLAALEDHYKRGHQEAATPDDNPHLSETTRAKSAGRS